MGEPILELRGITKRFGGTTVLNGIDLSVDWSVTTVNANQISVSVSVNVFSGALYSDPVPLGLHVGDQYVTLTSNAVNYDGGVKTYHPLGAQTFTVNAPVAATTSIPVEVSWHFGGRYGDSEVPVIECGNYINVTRN